MDIYARQGLVEALSPFRPKSLPLDLWDQVRRDAVDLVVDAHPRHVRHGRQLLSHLALFLAEVMPLRLALQGVVDAIVKGSLVGEGTGWYALDGSGIHAHARRGPTPGDVQDVRELEEVGDEAVS